jgi:NhaA family Na+:H+ antiporter
MSDSKKVSLFPPSVATAAKESADFMFDNSIFLIVGAVAALGLANTYSHFYHDLIHTELVHSTEVHINLHFIVNDVLMCFFFALAAKEIFESFLPGGALSSVKRAATPLLATVGGIVGPAGIYYGLTIWFGTPEAARGWAIPCATDIAFSYLVARIVFGKDHPAIPFLLLLAIADDAAGLVILAVFYPTKAISMGTFALFVGGAIGFNLILRVFKVRNFWLYLVVAGPLAWWGFFKGGIHPALALVPIIPTFPHASKDEGIFAEDHAHDPLNAFEHWWKRPVELILMAFGLANAGVAFSSVGATTWFVTIGLFVGKPVGIFLCALLAVKAFKLSLPDGMSFGDVLTLGCMAGIGFTVALFVSTVAFPAGTMQDAAKMGAVFSFGAILLSFLVAKITGVQKRPVSIRPPSELQSESAAAE